MALVSDMRAPISERRPYWNQLNGELAVSLLWAGFLTLLVAGPWLLPGYIFGTDWPGPRHFAWPSGLESSTPLEAAMAATAWAVGGEVTGKLVLTGSLFAAGFFAHRAVPLGGF